MGTRISVSRCRSTIEFLHDDPPTAKQQDELRTAREMPTDARRTF